MLHTLRQHVLTFLRRIVCCFNDSPILVAVGVGIGFILVAEILICAPARVFELVEGYERPPFDHIVALLSGSVTAAALAAIWFQAREARKNARVLLMEIGLRGDQLHAEYNTSEMRDTRTRAWKHLRYMSMNQQAMTGFVKWFVSSDETPDFDISPDSFDKRSACCNKAEPSDAERHEVCEQYQRAISCMLAFFVRLENHLRTNEIHGNSEQTVAEMVGPFHWSYWGPRLMPLVEACAVEGEPTGTNRLYFLAPLRRLNDRTRISRAAGAP
jgi:hypothetical protein